MGILVNSKVNKFLVSIIMIAILLCCGSQVQASTSGGGGSISGQVVDNLGNPVANANVSAISVDGVLSGNSASTDAGGNYSITNLASGEYRVHASSANWLRQYYSSNVSVTAPNDTPNINFNLQPGGSISGRVLDNLENPIANVRVSASLVNGGSSGGGGSLSGGSSGGGGGSQPILTTDAGGNYSITNLASGEYKVHTYADGWLSQTYASNVSVTAPNNTPNIIFHLQRGGSISGRVLDNLDNPVANARVSASLVNASSGGGSQPILMTDTSGNYRITNLVSGDYKVDVYADGWLRQAYSSNVSVIAPNDTANINFTLQRGGIISGLVLDSLGNPVSNATVSATPTSGGSGNIVRTDVSGNYSIENLESGEYIIYVSATGWPMQYYSSNVRVTAPDDTGNINFNLQQGGSISGQVSDNLGNPVVNATVSATPVNSGSGNTASTDASGNYSITSLASGEYRVGAWANGWVSQNFFTTGKVNVTAPNNTGNINFILQPAGSISGRVFDNQGNPFANASISVSPMNSVCSMGIYIVKLDTSGNYSLSSLASGTYKVEVQANGWISQASIVYVMAPNDTANVNFNMQLGGSISGKVFDAQGNPIANANVSANSVNGGSRSEAETDASGNYTITSLASGEYRVTVLANSWPRQYYVSNVSVTAPNDSPNINFNMQLGGSISGKILDAQGNSVANANVSANLVNGGSGNNAETDASGNYTITSLVSGEYQVTVSVDDWVSQNYAINVNVTAPDDTSNINFIMHQRRGCISGQVLDNLGSPVTNAIVFARPLNGGAGFVGYGAYTDTSGNYSIISLENGEYTVYVEANGWMRQAYVSTLNITAPNETANINFKLQRTSTPISNLSGTPANGQVTLFFSAPIGAISVSIIQKAGVGSYITSSTEPLTANSSNATVTGLTNDNAYTFKLVVVGGSFDGVSNEVTVTPTVDECFIATAAFGSKFTWPVALLRHFRDQYLLTNSWGTEFVRLYYRNSPPIAAIIAHNQSLRLLVRILLVPVIAMVYMVYHPILMITFLMLLIMFSAYQLGLRRRFV